MKYLKTYEGFSYGESGFTIMTKDRKYYLGLVNLKRDYCNFFDLEKSSAIEVGEGSFSNNIKLYTEVEANEIMDSIRNVDMKKNYHINVPFLDKEYGGHSYTSLTKDDVKILAKEYGLRNTIGTWRKFNSFFNHNDNIEGAGHTISKEKVQEILDSLEMVPFFVGGMEQDENEFGL